MATKKRYFQGLEELTNPSQVESRRDSEFAQELSTDQFLGDEDKLAESSTSRRDFLKFLGFSTAAASLAACDAPIQKAIPYVVKPEESVAGVANWYATSFYDGNDYAGILVKTREGRPIHLKGNKDSVTKGSVNARIQASVLSLYDSTRLTKPMSNGKETDWSTVDNDIMNKLTAMSAQGKEIAILSSSIISPSTKQIIADFATKYGNVRHVQYDAMSANGMLDANERNFGKRVIPTYSFDKADVIVSFGADFLSDWIDVVHEKDYIANRDPKKGSMSRHYQFEANLSLSGANADVRVPVKGSEEAIAVAALYNKLAKSMNHPSFGTVSGLSDAINKKLDAAAKDLKAARRKAIVVSNSNDSSVQEIVNGINFLLASYGNTMDLDKVSYLKQGNDADLTGLVKDMNSGKVGALLTYNCNPLYNLPSNLGFEAAMSKVGLTVSFSLKKDETSSKVGYILPDNHYLESWGDAMPYEGAYSLIQPTITPLFDSRQFQESLLVWTGNNESYYDYLKAYWKNNVLDGLSWNTALHDGAINSDVASTPRQFNPATLSTAISKVAGIKSNGAELVLYTKTGIGTGEQASNPWLQELPDPISKATWDNYLTMSPKYAKSLGIINDNESDGSLFGDIVEIEVNGVKLTLPVLIQPGQANETVGLAVGYGRSFGRENENGEMNIVGVNAFPVMNGFNHIHSVKISKVEGTHSFACTQLHHTLMGRDKIVKEATLAEYNLDPKAGNETITMETYKGHQTMDKITLWEEHERDVHFWNLGIDLTKCTGCGACVIACHSENNVPVVGKDEVKRSRDMHWLRIDRYYSSDMTNDIADEKGIGARAKLKAMEIESASETLEVVFQPLMCQHCNHAPCENVCPVAATTHSREGLNNMTYNRCIGTRYCANNCPYKVRRFNWFQYAENDKFDFHMNDDMGKMVLNPDVVVRSRGVMEKCSMCVQIIQKGKLDAKKEGRKVIDGEVQTACAAACSTGAMTFGDVLDKESKVYAEKHDPRAYLLLEEINTQPSVFYQTKVRNKA